MPNSFIPLFDVAVAPLFTVYRSYIYICRSHDGLKETVLAGGNLFENVYGTSVFELMSKDSSLNTAFNKAMADYSVVLMKKVVEKYKGFEGLTSLVDVGGGSGAALRTIIAHYPSIRGLNFDLPQVLKEAPSYPGSISSTTSPISTTLIHQLYVRIRSRVLLIIHPIHRRN